MKRSSVGLSHPNTFAQVSADVFDLGEFQNTKNLSVKFPALDIIRMLNFFTPPAVLFCLLYLEIRHFSCIR